MIEIKAPCYFFSYNTSTKNMTSSIIHITAGTTLLSNADIQTLNNATFIGETEQQCLDKITELGLITLENQ